MHFNQQLLFTNSYTTSSLVEKHNRSTEIHVDMINKSPYLIVAFIVTGVAFIVTGWNRYGSFESVVYSATRRNGNERELRFRTGERPHLRR